jgi:hypothetical protein
MNATKIELKTIDNAQYDYLQRFSKLAWPFDTLS